MRLTIALDDSEVEIVSGSHIFVSNAYLDEYYEWDEVTEPLLADAVQRAEDLLMTFKARQQQAASGTDANRGDRPILPTVTAWY
ncbi:hypothetical protein [Geomesophilobacter sediminis]|uniref:Uncharacterized protein n=1 Tax=Geomesophilobacter sediminis TaxID=2798584 RepID=A0A8J7JG63_9BACT|nr:hypothetical protein [Geomesophilobacter sediminis]MBJ6725559.1 hypothetical protein [Geomesophilobacter sediminis]